MAELRRSPLDGKLPWALPGGAVELSEQRFARQIAVRLRLRASAYLAGLPLPLEPNRVAAMGPVRILWLGPDEFLVTTPDGAMPELLPRLARAVAGRTAAVIDVSSSRAVITLAGIEARAVLAKGCGLDLHPRAFAAGQCAQTLLARVPVILDQVSPAPAYRLFVRRSYAAWLFDWLADAAEEFRGA